MLKTIAELSQELQNKKISSLELTEFYLKRIKELDKDLNCFITLTEEEALAAAKAADQKRAAGQAGRLTGIPIAQKDIFCTKGIKTTCGSQMLHNFTSPYNATVVEKLNAAGTIMLGKTNMDEFAMGSSNENSHFGPVKNPWDKNCVAGGSSGGSAAAVAALLVPGATGTDTGGSIRQPAALCGITGIKPTYGRVSRYGMIAFASSLDQGGPLTRSAEDAALLLNAMAGFDEHDSTSVDLPVPDYTATLNDSLKGLRIGLPKEYFESLNSEMAKNLEEAKREYEKLGVQFKEISLPAMHLSIPAYYVIAPAECSSNLARYDGVRYGYRCKDPINLEDLYKRTRSEAFGSEVKRRIMIGTYVLSAGYYDAYYLKAQKIRRLIRDDFVKAFKEVDIIMSPTAPSTAFKFGEKTKDPISMYLSDIYTISVNLAGLPGISIPAGFNSHLPVGMQLVGNYFEEARLLNVAHAYQKVTDWHTRLPKAI
jgi:aspartyl-tRNA(Asn)/glutamyl-tRNA(Gln) amidotransferase subunit A